MQHFLFVPTESGQTEMAALTATRTVDAVEEAGRCQFGGRTGYLFDGTPSSKRFGQPQEWRRAIHWATLSVVGTT